MLLAVVGKLQGNNVVHILRWQIGTRQDTTSCYLIAPTTLSKYIPSKQRILTQWKETFEWHVLKGQIGLEGLLAKSKDLSSSVCLVGKDLL